MHAEGGRQYTLDALRERGQATPGLLQWEETARAVSNAILGHDSFNAGFGRHRLKPMLAARHKTVPERFDYPSSQTPEGFLVQILDRLEGFEPGSMLRYVTEGVMDRREPISLAIRVGIIDNLAYLRECYDTILLDADRQLQAQSSTMLRSFPGLHDFTTQLARTASLPAMLGTPPIPHADGFYHRQSRSGDVALDSLEAVEDYLMTALR